MSDRPSEPKERSLVRALGVRAVAAVAVNATIGSGIFVLPAAVALILGPAAPVAYIACAAVVALTVLCFAEAGSRVARTGGTYAYVETAFGPFAGFVAGTLYWLGCEVISNAAIAVVLVESIAALVPTAGAPLPRTLIMVVTFAALATVNIRGVKSGARLVEFMTAAKLAPLLVVAIAGLFLMQRANLAWDRIPSLSEFGRASLVLFFAFQGAETAVTASGEIKDPARTIPRALLLGILIVTAFYAGLQLSAQGVLGADLAKNQGAPIAATAERLFGRGGLLLVGGAAILSTFGTISGGMLSGPRLLLGFADDRLLPAPVGALHSRFRTPHVAILIHAVACLGFALSGTFRHLAVLSGIVTLMVYFLCCLSTLVLRAHDVRTDQQLFVLPGGPTIPILGALVIVAFLLNATRAEYVAVAWAIPAASLLYLVRPRSGRAGPAGPNA